MDRIAIISDIHSNLTALKVVLEDIKNRGITKIYCLGDIIGNGPRPNECLNLVFDNCEKIVKGNLEDWAVNSNNNDERLTWNVNLLTEKNFNQIKNLDFCIEINMSGSLIRMYHADPRGVNRKVLVNDEVGKKIELFNPSNKTLTKKIADIIIFGDAHVQHMQKFYNKTLINTGSVGSPIDSIRNKKKIVILWKQPRHTI